LVKGTSKGICPVAVADVVHGLGLEHYPTKYHARPYSAATFGAPWTQPGSAKTLAPLSLIVSFPT
jgi:hypothetical protein